MNTKHTSPYKPYKQARHGDKTKPGILEEEYKTWLFRLIRGKEEYKQQNDTLIYQFLLYLL